MDATRLSFTPQSQSMLANVLISSTILTVSDFPLSFSFSYSQHISLSGCDITLEIATHLSRIYSLSHLDLSMCDNLTPDHLSLILYRCGRTVMELNVSCSRIGRYLISCFNLYLYLIVVCISIWLMSEMFV